MRLNWIVCVAIVTGLVVPMSVVGGPATKEVTTKDWTLMMYWDADNNLEFCTEYAFVIWEKALPSNDRINIVVLVDILSSEGISIYDIVDGKRRLVAAWPESDSSDPATLTQFVSYGLSKYPADKTMLVVQDHGYGWRGVCQDETSGDTIMSIDGLAEALNAVKKDNKGKGIDLLAFDACHMNTLEVAYELRDAVSYVVASQSMVPYDGLPYEMFLNELVAEPDMAPAELASRIVHDYVMFYSDKKAYEHIYTYNQDFSTVAAFDMSKMAALGGAFIDFAEQLLPLVAEYRSEIEGARGAAQVTQWANSAGYEWMPDVYAFIEGLEGMDEPLDAAISSWKATFADALVAEGHSERMGTNVHGLNFWFPPSLAQYNSLSWTWAQQFVYHDMCLDIVSESAWVDCLMEYYLGS
ncbi:MAG: hypothetical protein JW880_02850 [Candidatus Thermoplasmatota archaeon]|nr:hypothetical protein [Candidatus Thermoplasmatota archaeon]